MSSGRDACKSAGYWGKLALRWQQLGPPLRPSAEDLAVCQEVIGRWSGSARAPRAMVLGTTPEYFHLPWSAGTELVAVDYTQAMIDRVWPGGAGGAICADWQSLPLADASRDIVLCDGGLLTLRFPEGVRKLAENLRRIIAPQGFCVFRCYVLPEKRETVETVLGDFRAGRISNLNELKMRLWLAANARGEEGVELAHVWEIVHDIMGDADESAQKTGWPTALLRAIDHYRGCSVRFFFFDVKALCDIFCREIGGFELVEVRVPGYAMGPQCPTVVFRRA
ncbi:MAG: methyltransferase domain-containing protein [Tepidisphaeraceae bacterium]